MISIDADCLEEVTFRKNSTRHNVLGAHMVAGLCHFVFSSGVIVQRKDEKNAT